MKSNLALLTIRKVIIHQVPKHKKSDDGGQPRYSEIESPLDDELRIYFQVKMVESLGSKKSFDICFKPGSLSPVPGCVDTYLRTEDSDFVAMSKQMADHLYAIQDGTNPGGLLTVMDCEVNGLRALGLIKLEKEEGVRLEQKLQDNLPTFDLHVLRDLVLTEKTRVYKLALFVIDPDSEDDFDAAASDHQTGARSMREMATFFLADFLGCALRQNPVISTKTFFDSAEEFINEQIDDPILQTQYLQHVVSEMLSQSPTISTEQFANQYLPVDSRQAFITKMETCNVPPNFPKNNEMIERRLRKKLFEFQSGVRVVAPNNLEEGILTVSNGDDGKTKLEVKDNLLGVKNK